jgi:hypothetical protein
MVSGVLARRTLLRKVSCRFCFLSTVVVLIGFITQALLFAGHPSRPHMS